MISNILVSNCEDKIYHTNIYETHLVVLLNHCRQISYSSTSINIGIIPNKINNEKIDFLFLKL